MPAADYGDYSRYLIKGGTEIEEREAEGQLAEVPDGQPVIQLAILLDDSGSMSGLIDQARAHIWDVVHQLSATTKDGKTPVLQVALYHYGDVPALHKPLLAFTSDLDIVSKKLFAINGGGGEEHCGEVIRNAAQQLSWSKREQDLRMIVIAGNEPFNQGSIDYKEAITAARAKDIVVSTIHCGQRAQGVAGMWSDGSHYGGGQFSQYRPQPAHLRYHRAAGRPHSGTQCGI